MFGEHCCSLAGSLGAQLAASQNLHRPRVEMHWVSSVQGWPVPCSTQAAARATLQPCEHKQPLLLHPALPSLRGRAPQHSPPGHSPGWLPPPTLLALR